MQSLKFPAPLYTLRGETLKKVEKSDKNSTVDIARPELTFSSVQVVKDIDGASAVFPIEGLGATHSRDRSSSGSRGSSDGGSKLIGGRISLGTSEGVSTSLVIRGPEDQKPVRPRQPTSSDPSLITEEEVIEVSC